MISFRLFFGGESDSRVPVITEGRFQAEGFGITADAADVPNLQPSGAGYDGIVFRYLRRLVFQCSPAADAA